MAFPEKRLYRPREDRVFAGLCTGLGIYFGTDPVAIRLAWIVVSCLTGFVPGLIAYVLGLIIVPSEPIVSVQTPVATPPATPPSSEDPAAPEAPA